MKPWLLRLHRWITLILALPLLVVIGTGLILSVEPAMQTRGVRPGAISTERVAALLDKADPEGKARALSIRAYENTLAVSGVGDEPVELDLTTGEEIDDGQDFWSEIFSWSRGVHEHFLYEQTWLVHASTWGMLALALLGVLMGWPRLRNTVSGWHKGVAWILLPLVVLSPLTGLAIVFGVTFAGTAQRPAGPAPSIRESVALLGASHDLSTLVSLRTRGGRMVARLNESGELRNYVVTKDGVAPAARNWPRLIHEGNWAGYWSAAINVVTSIAMLALLATGLFIWGRRRVMRWRKRRPPVAVPQPAE